MALALEGVYAVLPLLIMIGIGYAVAKKPWFGRTGMNCLSKFNMYILLPVFMFTNVTRMYKQPGDLVDLVRNLPYPIVLIGSGLLIGSVMTLPLRIRAPQRGIFINGVGLSNTVVIGMPVALSLFGEAALPIVMMYYACNTITYWTVGVWLMRRETPNRIVRGLFASLWEVVSTPPLAGFLVGIAWVLLRLPVPRVMQTTMNGIGNSVVLVSMVFIGSVIRFADLSNAGKFRALRILLPYKYLLSPVIACFLCWLLPLPLLMKQVFFIQANMPAMAQLPIMAKEIGADYEFASLATAITTTCSMVAAPLYIFLIEYSGVFAA